MQHLHGNFSQNVARGALINDFDDAYVIVTYRRVKAPADGDANIAAVGMRRLTPQFNQHLWKTHLLSLNDRTCADNVCECRNASLNQPVGDTHFSVRDAIVSTLIFKNRRLLRR